MSFPKINFPKLNFTKIKTSTIAYLGLLAVGSLASQVTWVNKQLAQHPKLAPVGGFVLAGLALLHSPVGEQIISQFTESTESKKPDGSVETKQVTSTVSTTMPLDSPAVADIVPIDHVPTTLITTKAD